MIQIYDIGNENYDRNGNAVLTPTAGRVTMQAGGACDISLTLPMDPEGKWRHVVPGAVVKAPVPREVIENSFSGYAADIYKTVGAADLREDKVAPTPISYPQWNAMDMTYTVGSRVSCYGWPHQNYECTYFDNSSPITQVPPYNSAWWKPIADYTPGAAVVVSLPAGSELYWIENAGSGWYKMSTYYGLEGYIQTSAVVFDRHVSETENQPRIITEQLFRLREPSINNETRTVTVTGQHVSYDLAGNLCKNITITQASPAMAMGRITENLMMDYRGTIATNLTSEENGTYTGKTNGKNGMFMLLDPDAGIVHAFNAKFTRDNWDVFVMKKTSALSGYRISYAKNMRGVTWKKSSAGLVTRVVPVAKNTDGEDLYLPEKWVDSAHIAEYPVVLMELLRISAQVGRDDGTGTDTVWTESALYDYMREKAGERFSVDHVDEVVDDLTVQFEQLGDTAEYEWIRPLESVLLYDNIVCQDLDIGLEKTLTVTELEWDPIRRKVTGIRLSNITGAAGRTVTGFNVQNNSITPAKLTEEVTQEIVGQVQALIPDYTDPQAGSRPNTRTQDGVVTKGQGQGNKIWKTDNDGNPAWRDESSFALPLAADGVRGGIQIGFTAYGKNYPVALDNEKAYVYVPWSADGGNAATVNGHTVATNVPAGAVFTDHIYGAGTGLSLANDGTFAVRLAYTTSGKNYKVQADASGNLYVNVPWTDHYAWSDITDKPATATRWPTWDEVTGKPSFHYLPLAGGTMTGRLTFNTVNAIAYQGTKAWYDMIKFKDNPSDTYGNGIVIGGGGLTVIGGGESADTMAAQVSSGGDENLFLCNDGNIDFYTNCQSGATSAVHTWIDTSGVFHGTATNAQAVPWSGVSDKPATATRWPTWAEVTGKPNRAGSDSDGGVANSAKTTFVETISSGSLAAKLKEYWNARRYNGFLIIGPAVSGSPNNNEWVIVEFFVGESIGNAIALKAYRYGSSNLEYRGYAWRNQTYEPTWYTVLNSANYTDYTVTKTGGGASGTWGIDISGNAATANSANTATNADKLDGYHEYDFGILATLGWGGALQSRRSTYHHIVMFNQSLASVWVCGTNEIYVVARNGGDWTQYYSSSGSVTVTPWNVIIKRTDGSSTRKITVQTSNGSNATISILSL